MTHNFSLAQPAARTFRAPSMAEALAVVQRELGPEALILSVRQVPGGPAWQIWRKPIVEVAALAAPKVEPKSEPHPQPQRAAEGPAEARPEPRRPTGRTAPLTPPSGPNEFATKAAQIQALLAEMKAARPAAEAPAPAPAPARPAKAAPAASPAGAAVVWPEAVTAIQQLLLEQGVDAHRVRSALNLCVETLNPRALDDRRQVREHVQRQLEAELRAWGSATLAAAGSPRVVCLVGASGSGKTTVAGKLAALHTRAHNLRVAWVCADTYRAGAIGQARVYAESLKLPLRVAYTGSELAQAVQAERGADLILVDLPGLNPRRETDLAELGELLTALPHRLTCLVASATAKDSDLADALAAYSMFDLKGLILTKLDETRTAGNLYNLAARSRLPLMYFSAGPGALEGLQPASASRLVAALFRGFGASLGEA
ncbi:MAG: hypothetical protein JNK29_16795 [Anaerolineales bacterium]|nr:hypothetical protein [Anaerolineales bacterium]